MAHAWGAEMVRMCMAGTSIAEIAKRFALPEASVKQVIIRFAQHPSAALNDPSVSPGPPLSSPTADNPMADEKRRDEMREMRRAGKTLAEIGDHFSVTRERVRQIVGSAGKEEGRASRSASRRREIEERNQADRLANEARLVHERELRREEKRKQSIAVLQRAATYTYPLTGSAYDALIEIGEIPGPSRQAVIVQFGSWIDACETAGVESGKAHHDNYSRRWSRIEMLQYVAVCWKEIGKRPTAAGYAKWAQSHEGAPSGGTLRNVFGGWRSLLSELDATGGHTPPPSIKSLARNDLVAHVPRVEASPHSDRPERVILDPDHSALIEPGNDTGPVLLRGEVPVPVPPPTVRIEAKHGSSEQEDFEVERPTNRPHGEDAASDHASIQVELRNLRSMRGLRRANVAKELGVSQGQISQWVRGIARPTAVQHAALKVLLNSGNIAQFPDTKRVSRREPIEFSRPDANFLASIRRLRGRQGMSQTELGQLVGVEQSQVSRWETGKDTPSVSQVRRLGAALLNASDSIGLVAEELDRTQTPPSIARGFDGSGSTEGLKEARAPLAGIPLDSLPAMIAALIVYRGKVSPQDLESEFEEHSNLFIPPRLAKLFPKFAWSAKGRGFIAIDDNGTWIPGERELTTISALSTWTYSELVDKAATICEIGKPFPRAQLIEEAFSITAASAPKLILALASAALADAKDALGTRDR